MRPYGRATPHQIIYAYISQLLLDLLRSPQTDKLLKSVFATKLAGYRTDLLLHINGNLNVSSREIGLPCILASTGVSLQKVVPLGIHTNVNTYAAVSYWSYFVFFCRRFWRFFIIYFLSPSCAVRCFHLQFICLQSCHRIYRSYIEV